MKPYDLAIAIPTYFGTYGNGATAEYRYDLYLNCMNSLKAVDFKSLVTIAIIRDDASPYKYIPLVSDTCNLEINFYKYNPARLGMAENCRQTILDCCALAYWVLWLDPDSLVAPNLVDRWQHLLHAEPQALGYSMFNSKYHPVREDRGTYLIKSSAPELGMIFRSDDLKNHQYPTLGQGIDPNNIGWWPTAKPSAIQHTGRKGMNNPEEDDFDSEFTL